MNTIKNKTLVLSASAGTGKTFALTARYISLLLTGAKPHEILTLTFTNKAALQMNQRIFKTLQELGEDIDIINAISKQTGLTSDEIAKQKDEILSSFISSETSIFTIDKFVNKILREFSGYSDVSDSFEIKQDDIEKIGFEFLASLDESAFNTLINFSHYSQKQFVSLLEVFKSLIVQNEEIKNEFIEENALIGAKEQLFKQALKIKEYVLNHEKSSDTAKKSVSFENFDEIFKSTWVTKDKFADFKSFTKAIQCDFIEDEFTQFKIYTNQYFWMQSNYNLRVLNEIFLKFKSFKSNYQNKRNYLEFSDIANLTYKLLSTTLNGQTDFLYFRLDAKYNHILIDEFQDTSLLQYKILKPLIDEVFNGIGTSYKTFFYVGDIKQSIYRFRGGKSDLFDYLSSNYDNLKVENLTRNYRSSSNIVKFVNDVFMPLPNFDMVEQSWNKEGGLVEVIDVDEDFGKDKEFKDILNTINDLLEKGMSPNDIAILTYTNADVLNILEYLKQHLPSIEISTDMTSKLINVSNVKAIINYIKYLYFPIDKRDIYKENFNTLVGYELKKEMELHINIKTNNLRQIIYECAKYYDLFDDNVIKFLSNIDQYTDVVDFIYNIHNDESTIVNKHSLGITILTVFKSKGLEFDTVLLLDRIKSKNSDKSSLLFEYDKVNLKQTHYKIKYKEFFDNQYKDALEEEKRLQYLDELNILYVALTRAENNLFIFKKQKKKSSKSVNAFDIIKHNNTSIGSLIIKPKEKIENNIIKIKEYKSLELGLQNKKKANDTNESNIYAQYFGIATHYCLEMMNKFDMNSLDKSILQTRARYSNYLNDEDFKKIFRICKNLIENMNFQSMIKGFDITKEQALNFNGEMKILDLLCMKKDEIIVFDYKTTISHNTEHNSQVSYYKKALSTIFPKAKVEGFLVYLQENSVDIINV